MRKYLLFAVVARPVLLGHIGSTAMAVAFPTMVSHFGTSLVLAGWVLSVYQLVVIGAIPVAARLSDTVGRKSVFTYCLVLFIIGSFLCAVAPNVGWLIFFRMIQAAGGGGFVSVASGILSDEVPDSRQQFIGLLNSIANLGSLVGPNLGAVMVVYLGWQSVFWLNVPIAIIALVLFRHLVKADVKRAGHGEIDLLGVALLSGFVSSVMISLTLMGKAYQMPPIVIVSTLLLGVLFLLMFVYRSRKLAGAVDNLELLTGRPFLASNIYNFIFGTCAQSGVMSLMPLYAISVYGVSVLKSGLIMTPRSLGAMVASMVASFSLLKWGYRRPIIVGTVAISVGMAVLALEPSQVTLAGVSLTPVVLVMLFALLAGAGAGLATPAAANAGIDLMPDQVASIAGLRQVFRQMGAAIGIAVSTLVLESSANMPRGFTVVFMGAGVIMLLSIPAVFYMPAGPRRLDQPAAGHGKKG
ncbi:MAG: MFS transporter [Chloroflexota bacterium]